jgi:hypothetical protein
MTARDTCFTCLYRMSQESDGLDQAQGMTARKRSITDPFYYHPDNIDDGK